MIAVGQAHYEEAGVVRLRNCPFHRLAQVHTELVCSVNLALMTGLAGGVNEDEHLPLLDPGDDRCCVAFQRR